MAHLANQILDRLANGIMGFKHHFKSLVELQIQIIHFRIAILNEILSREISSSGNACSIKNRLLDYKF